MTSPQRQEDEGASTPAALEVIIPDHLRLFSRSPHPYHRKSSKRLESESLHDNGEVSHPTTSGWSRTSSDSGTEADDESTGILKGLPAPPLRPRKGLRSGPNGIGDGYPWFPPFQSWPLLARPSSRSSRRSSEEEADAEAAELRRKFRRKRRIEVLRRLFETGLLLSVGGVVLLQEDVRSLAWSWRKELFTHALLVAGLYAVYPLCVSCARNRRKRTRLSNLLSFSIPPSFDPAPLLYPILIPIYVSLSLTHHRPSLILPNILLSLSSLPAPVIPLHGWINGDSITHWMVTLIPIIASEHVSLGNATSKPLSLRGLDSETLTLVFPLHQALIPTLDFLLTTSILPAELQLLTTALINLFLFATSPQAEILKALLWLGGMCVFVACRHILRWEVALARIPSWKFRRSPGRPQSPKHLLNVIDHKLCEKLSRTCSPEEPSSDSDAPHGIHPLKTRKTMHIDMLNGRSNGRGRTHPGEPASAVDNVTTEEVFQQHFSVVHRRRHTISTFEEVARTERVRTTPSGRRKRSMAPGLASFLSMTTAQAQVRKWVYALYVYAAVFVTIMGPIRKYVSDRALGEAEPFGWALGYLFGNVPGFRFWVVMMNLERWIVLPARLDDEALNACCFLGWVESLRQGTFGEANTRLLVSGYCVVVLLTGLAIVFQLSMIVEVDTRRKVFHGMMVLMFLPTIYVDPTFCALALALVLSIFLLLDLFRASQLPPISRPLTHFLAPYVDGRDHRGPVIISHIFLLIGCSVPLWLSLADIPRTSTGSWSGWNVVYRDVSMVSGVICVGMGDAAASLVGRRLGRLKWFWGGGKSLEGSVAFTMAVFCGLLAARAWLDLGRWPVNGSDGNHIHHFWALTGVKAILAAAGASATEAILTGCNDNVAVPIVLWLLVRGLGI